MKIFLYASTALAALATSASAGSVVAFEPETVAVAAPATTDWSGLYIGLAAGYEFGEYDQYGNALDYLDTYQVEGALYGGFAGYNFQRNALVFGGEIAYSLGGAKQVGNVNISEQLDYVVDIKARAGYAFGNLLAYGVIGGSMGQWSDTNSSNTYNFSGLNYGGGVEAQFGNGFFGGLEYLARTVSGESSTFAPAYSDFRFQTVQLRLGKRF